jgi:phage shock protein PspC (stress-responsive transcriptional regulator)/predicted membrane protein
MMETNTTESPPAADRPLRRSSSDRMIAGVAGGIAQRLDIPAWVVRVAFVVLAFGGALGVALYVAGWLLIPRDDESETVAQRLLDRVQDRSDWVGVVLIAVGALIAVQSIGFIRGDLALAVFLGVIGVLLYRGEIGRRSGSDRPPPPPPDPADPTAAADAPSPTAPTVAAPVVAEPGAAPPAPPRPRRTHPPSILGRLAIAFALIGTGVMAFFDYAVSTFDPSPRHYLGLVLGIVGVALVVGSVLGRARGLIVLGVVLTPLLVLSPLAEFDVTGGVGQRRVHPSSVADIPATYDLAIGELVVDLRDVDFAGQVVELATSVGIGSLRVLVPSEEVAVRVNARVGIGEAQALGAVRAGFAREVETSRDGDGLLVIDAQVLIGEVRVTASDGFTAVPTSAWIAVVTDPGQLQAFYELSAGDISLDLSQLVLTSPREVTISVGAGDVYVRVPDRTTTGVFARAGVGEIRLFESLRSGIDLETSAPASGPPLLTLHIDVDAGTIIVEEG